MSPRKVSLLGFLITAFAVLLVACSGQPTATPECLEPGSDGTMVNVSCDVEGAPTATPTPTPDEGNNNGDNPGLAVFRSSGCGTCHTLEGVPGATGTVGPNLSQIGSVAGTRVPGQSAEDYIRESIVDPNAFVVEGFPQGVMPQVYGSSLSEQQINDLVAYLASRQ